MSIGILYIYNIKLVGLQISKAEPYIKSKNIFINCTFKILYLIHILHY